MALHTKFRHFSSHIQGAIFQDFDCVHGFEKSPAHVCEAWEMHFCTQRRVFACAHVTLGFDNAERYSGRSDNNWTQKNQILCRFKG